MRGRDGRGRLLALGALLAALVGVVVLVAARGGGDDAADARRAAAPVAPPPPELPRGGRRILPDFRVVAFYGAPQDDELGVLGIGTLTQAGRRLRAVAATYRSFGRPVLPAMELLAVIANAAPGDDGKYRSRQTDAVIGRHLRAARRAKALLILDIQPGQSDFFSETRRLARWLREPDVSLALDPEWHTPEAVPGSEIGYVEAREVNAISFYLADIVRRHRLPQKLLLVHRFTDDALRDDGRIKQRRDVRVTISVDGFGGQEIKRQKYEAFDDRTPRLDFAFKLFYKEDTDLMSPRQVMRLRPRPEVVIYE